MKKESQAKIASLIDKFEWAIEKGKELDYNMILSELNAINFIECTSGVGASSTYSTIQTLRAEDLNLAGSIIRKVLRWQQMRMFFAW